MDNAEILVQFLFKTHTKPETILIFDESCVWVNNRLNALQTFGLQWWKQKVHKGYRRYMITEWTLEYEICILYTKHKHKLNLLTEFFKDIISGKKNLKKDGGNGWVVHVCSFGDGPKKFKNCKRWNPTVMVPWCTY